MAEVKVQEATQAMDMDIFGGNFATPQKDAALTTQGTTTPTKVETDPLARYNLTEVERKLYTRGGAQVQAQIAKQASTIDVMTPTSYKGPTGEIMKESSQISSQSLKLAKVRDLGETGTVMRSFVTTLKGLTPHAKKETLLFKAQTIFEALKAQGDSAEDTIKKAESVLAKHQNQLETDDNIYRSMIAQLENSYVKMCFYVISFKMAIADAKVKYEQLANEAAISHDPQAASNVAEYARAIDKFEKWVAELETAKVSYLQAIEIMRDSVSNNDLMIDKLTILQTITADLWRTNIQMLINQQNSISALNAVDEASSFTNELIRRNAQQYHETAVGVAKATEKTVIDPTTLIESQQQIIDTWEEVEKIHSEGKSRRSQLSQDTAQLELQMQQAMIQRYNPNATIE